MTNKVSYHRQSWSRYNRTWTQGSAPVENSTDGSVEWSDGVTYGQNYPDWKQRIRNNVSATTTLDGNKIKFDFGGGYMRFDKAYCGPITDPDYILNNFPASYNEVGGQLLGISSVLYPSGTKATQAEAEAIEAFVQQARSIQTQFESGVFLGQLRQTLDQITSPAKALRQGLTQYLTSLTKKRKRTKKIDKHKLIADTWLEYVYGWRPLINDISGAILAATEQPSLSDVQHVRVSKTVDDVIATIPSSYSNPGLLIQYDIVVKESYSVRYEGAVFCYADDKPSLVYGNESMRSLGLTIDNFAPTVWELIPYSFIVDYFTNIGDVLSALSYPTSNFAWKNRCTSNKISVYHTNFRNTQTIFTDPTWTILVTGHLGKSTMTNDYVSRYPHIGNLIPDLRFKVPGATSLKWLNLAALGHQHRSLLPF